MANIRYIANVLNQKGAPAIFEDTFANRPTAGYIGRIFISTDTFVIQRDNGTTWDSLGGAGSITGSGAAGQVTFWSSASAISGDNTFFWDNTNKRLGLGTVTPGVRLDVHGTGVIAQFNGTTTNNAYLDFQNAGTTRFRIGNVYNAGANDFSIQLPVIPLTNAFYMLGSNGWLGLGTSVPQSRLHISNTVGFVGLTIGETGATAKQFYIGVDYTGNGYTYFQSIFQGTSATPIVLNKDGGNVAVGSYTTPAVALAVNGSIYQGSNTANSNFQMLCAGNFYTGGFTPNFSTYTSNITISVGVGASNLNTGYVFKTAATITVNLPAASGINNQFYFVVLTGTTVTVNRAGSDNIINTVGTTVTSLTLTGYTKTMLYCDGGSTWYQLF